jgi:phosphatidylglycerol lysyltransferase
LSGVLLLLLARSLYRRYDSAYRVTQFLLLGGIVFSLLKGLDWEEASILSLLFLLMLLGLRRERGSRSL